MPYQLLNPNVVYAGSIEQNLTVESAPAEAYTGPGLALFSSLESNNWFKATERFEAMHAADIGIFKNYILSKLAPEDVGAVYKVTNGIAIKLSTDSIPPEYTFQNESILLETGLTVGQILYLVPNANVSLNFLGNSGVSITEMTSVYLRVMNAYNYGMVYLYSIDLDKTDFSFTQSNCSAAIYESFTRVIGFLNLVPNKYVGYGVLFEGEYIGKVVANTETYLTLDLGTFASNTPGEVRLLPLGNVEFAIDQTGIEPIFAPILIFPLIESMTGIKLRLRETLTMPLFSTYSPNIGIKIDATEYRG